MKKIIEKIIDWLRFRRCNNHVAEADAQPKSTIIGSWRFTNYIDTNNIAHMPRWKEVWSFAAMDETETHGIYACDYINLHTVIGKWQLKKMHLDLERKGSKNRYNIAKISDDTLILKFSLDCGSELFVFKKIV